MRPSQVCGSLEIQEKLFAAYNAKKTRSEAASLADVTWDTARRWYTKFDRGAKPKIQASVVQQAETMDLKSIKCGFESHPAYQSSYLYLLGMYLGDGYINKQGDYVYKIRITLDASYPKVIEECRKALEIVFEGCKSNVVPHKGNNGRDVFLYNSKILFLFPQGKGKGKKHLRDISLTEWQKEVIKMDPKPFIKGLLHSDGSRYRSGGSLYYNFSNLSKQLRDMFRWACSLVGVECAPKDVRNKTVSIYKRDSVELLDDFVGPK